MDTFIRWPTGSEAQRAKGVFERKRGLADVYGAIDGTHIPIQAPIHDHEAYINKKGFHSVILQAVCDDRMFFTDIYAGWPGSVHDARVFSNSPPPLPRKWKQTPRHSYQMGVISLATPHTH